MAVRNLFDSTFNVTPFTFSTSHGWTSDVAGTIAVDTGSVIVNSVDSGASYSIGVGDVVAIKLRSSSNFNTAKFAVVTITPTVGTAFTSYYGISTYKYINPVDDTQEHSFAFSLLDVEQVQPNTVIDSSSFIIEKLVGNVEMVVAPILGAMIVKNGVEVGTTESVTNGDEVFIRWTSPTTYDTEVHIPVFVGGYTDSIDTCTSLMDAYPLVMPTTHFVNVLTADRSTHYTSNEVVVTGINTGIPASVVNGTLIVNDSDLGATSATVYNGDRIRVKAKSSFTPLSVVHCVLNLSSRQLCYSIVTQERADDGYRLAQVYLDSTPFDLSFTPQHTNNRLLKLNTTTSVFTEYSMAQTPTNPVDSSDYTQICVPDYYQDTLSFFNTSGVLLHRLNFNAGVRPYAVTNSPRVSPGGFTVSDKLVTLRSSQQVAVVNTQTAAYSVSQYIALSGMPYGIDTDTNNTTYVAQSNGVVAVITKPSTVYQVNTVTPGGHLFDVFSSGTSTFISDTLNKRVLEYVDQGTLYYSYACSGVPWGVFATADYLYVAVASLNVVEVFSRSTHDLIYTIPTLSLPTKVYVEEGSAQVYVSHFGTTKILKINQTNLSSFTVYNNTGTQASVYGMGFSDATTMWVASLYSNTPSMVEPKQTMTVGVYPSFVDQERDVEVVTTPFFFQTQDYEVALSLQPINGARMVVAYQDGGTFYTIPANASGYYIFYQQTSKEYFDRSNVYMFIDGQERVWQIRTVPSLTPSVMYFTGVFNIEVGIEVVSGVATISGLTDTYVTTIRYENDTGFIRLNGEDTLPNESVTVTNGDQIQLVSVVQPPYGMLSFHNIVHIPSGKILATYKMSSILLDGAIKDDSGSEHEYVRPQVYVENTFSSPEQFEASPVSYCPVGAETAALTGISRTQLGIRLADLATETALVSPVKFYADLSSPDLASVTYGVVDQYGFDVYQRSSQQTEAYDYVLADQSSYSLVTNTPQLRLTTGTMLDYVGVDIGLSAVVYEVLHEYTLNIRSVVYAQQQDYVLDPYHQSLLTEALYDLDRSSQLHYIDGLYTKALFNSYSVDGQFELVAYPITKFIAQSYELAAPVVVYETNLIAEAFEDRSLKLTNVRTPVKREVNLNIFTELQWEVATLTGVHKGASDIQRAEFKSQSVQGMANTIAKYSSPMLVNARFARNEFVVFDTVPPTIQERGLFSSVALAYDDAFAEGFVDNLYVYVFDGGYMWSTVMAADASACSVSYDPYPIGGWIRGG